MMFDIDRVLGKKEITDFDVNKMLSVSKQGQMSDFDIDKIMGTQQPDNEPSFDIEKMFPSEKTDKPLKGGIKANVVNDFMRGINSGLNTGLSRMPAALYDLASIPQNLLVEKIFNRPDLVVQSPDWLLNNPVARYYEDQAETYKSAPIPDFDTSFAALKEGNPGPIAEMVVRDVITNAPTQLAIIASAMSGVGAAGIAGMGLMEMGSSLKEGRDEGVDPTTNALNSALKGTIEAGFESLGTFGLFDKWSKVLYKSVGKDSTKKILGNVAQALFASAVGEGNEEFWTSIGQDMSDRYVKGNKKALDGMWSRAIRAGLTGAASGFGMTGPGAVASGIKRGLTKSDGTSEGVDPATFKHNVEMGEQSKPLPSEGGIKAYRGTSTDSGKFRTRSGVGPHFGTKEQAEFVSKVKGGDKGVVKEVELDIKNPIRLEDRNAWENLGVLQQLREQEIVSEEETQTLARDEDFDVKELLKSKGYDGIVYANTAEGKGDSYITFDDSQIKETIKTPSVEAGKNLAKKLIGKRPSDLITETRRETTRLKERIMLLARGARIGYKGAMDESRVVKRSVKKIVRESDLSRQDKDAIIVTALTSINTFKQLENTENALYQVIDELGEKRSRQKLISKIKSTLSKTKTKKVAGKVRGKYTGDVQAVLDMARSVVKLTQQKALDKILQNMEQYSGEVLPKRVVLENKLLSMMTRNSDDLRTVLDEINEVIKTGRLTKSLRDIVNKEEKDSNVNDAIDVITGGRGIAPPTNIRGEKKPYGFFKRFKSKLATLSKSISSWDNLLDMLSVFDVQTKLSGKEILLGRGVSDKSRLSKMMDVHDAIMAEKEGKQSRVSAVTQSLMEIFGLKSAKEVVNLLQEGDVVENLGVFVNARGETVDLDISRNEARKKWMELQDPDLFDTLTGEKGNALTQEMVLAIEKFLTDKGGDTDFKFAEWQLNFYKDYRNQINETYERRFGVNMPEKDAYSPISRKTYTEESMKGFDQFMDEIRYRNSVTNPNLLARTNSIEELKYVSDVDALMRYINNMEHFMAWSDKVIQIEGVFKNSKVRESITEIFGKGILNIIDKQITHFTRNSADSSKDFETIEKMRINFMRAILAVKPSIMIKQLTSFPAYAETIPTTAFISGVYDFFKHPLRNAKILLGDAYMKERGNTMDRDIQIAMKSDAYNEFNKNPSFMNTLLLNVQLGDKGAILVGGWAVYKYHLKKTGNHEKAIDEFRRTTDSTQQSGSLSQLSNMQRAGTLGKLFTMFKSAQNMYLRKEISALRNLVAGRANVRQVAKTIAIYHFILPMLFQFVASGFKWDKDEQKRAAIFGSLNGMFIFGEILNNLVRKALGMKTYSEGVALIQDMEQNVRKLYKTVMEVVKNDDVSFGDVIDATKALAATSAPLHGLPIEPAIDMSIGGISDMAEGEYVSGLKKALGWSPYIVEGQGKKKKKKKRSGKGLGLNLDLNLDLDLNLNFDIDKVLSL